MAVISHNQKTNDDFNIKEIESIDDFYILETNKKDDLKRGRDVDMHLPNEDNSKR